MTKVAQTMPMQISEARLTAISNTCSGAGIDELAMMMSIQPASMAA